MIGDFIVYVLIQLLAARFLPALTMLAWLPAVALRLSVFVTSRCSSEMAGLMELIFFAWGLLLTCVRSEVI